MKGRRCLGTALALALGASLPIAAASGGGPGDVLVDALKHELARSSEKLVLDGQERPYYLEYTVLDTTSFTAVASFGALVSQDDDRSRTLRVEVRVGSPELDSSAFVSGPRSFGGFPRALVLDDDEDALRRDVWLATDAAYKQALEQLSLKRASLSSRVDAEPLPDFSREKPQVFAAAGTTLGPVATRPVAARPVAARAVDLSRTLSALFRSFPAVQESSVRLYVRAGRRIYLNTEGTLVTQPVPEVWLTIRAFAQAPDGMRLKGFRTFWADALDHLPKDAELLAEVRRLGTELTALQAAPVAEKYLGPVLFSGEAAGDLFAQILAPQLSGQRPPLFALPQMAAGFPKSDLAGRLRRLVLPRSLSVGDDPTQTEAAGQRLAGAFAVDDQGVVARPVSLIEKGILKGLLMSRRPSKEIPESNGHGRAGFGGVSAQIGNLFVRSSEGKSAAQLKKDLLDLCTEQGLAYGLLVRTLDVPAITGRETSGVSPFASSGSRPSLSAPLLVYKVYVDDGREELVRGAAIGEVTVRTLKEIVAAGDELGVVNRFSGDDGSSVIAPSVLFPEIEVAPFTGSQQKPVVLPHPFFAR